VSRSRRPHRPVRREGSGALKRGPRGSPVYGRTGEHSQGPTPQSLGQATGLSSIVDGIVEPQPAKGRSTDLAGVASPAGPALGCRVVATVGQGVIHAQLMSALDDLLLGQGQERGMNPESSP